MLTTDQAKMLKSEKIGYLSAILNLQPNYKINGENTCPNAGQCIRACLQYAGRNAFDMAHAARIRKTRLYYENRTAFYAELVSDIEALKRKAQRENYLPTVRLNGLSDLAFERDNVLSTGKNIFQMFDDVQFIDYTKRYVRLFEPQNENYHLTYSINERTPAGIVRDVYKRTRFNCCAVFYPHLPSKWEFDAKHFEVIAGDDHDLRQLDPRGKVIGLTFKKPLLNGKRKTPKEGFVFFTAGGK